MSAPWARDFSRQQSLKKGTAVDDIDIFSMRDIQAVGSLAFRTQRSTITRATAFLALILLPSLGSAAIYKCTAQDGSITYTDAPCPDDTTTQYIDPAAPPVAQRVIADCEYYPGASRRKLAIAA